MGPAAPQGAAGPVSSETVSSGSVSADVAARIEIVALRLAEDLSRAPVGSPSFNRTLARIERIGDREMRATTQITGSVDDRHRRTLDSLDIGQLRSLAYRAGPGANVKAGSREDLQRLFSLLEEKRSALMADGAALRQQQRALALQARRLREFAALFARLDALLSDPVRAIPADTVYALRQHRGDLVAQAAIAVNAHAALRRMSGANDLLIRAMRAAGEATLVALRSGAGQSVSELLVAVDELDRQRRTAFR